MKLCENVDNISTTIKNSKAYSIEASGAAFKILTDDLYKNPIRAIVRELSTNAVDACKAAGVAENNFKITLPSLSMPTFSVEDFGIGMDEEEILETYTTLFKSTKSNSNDQTGMFGLGSKTPFAYTSQFTIESSKNGVKNIFLAFKDNSGMPNVSKVTSVPSTSSGTKVTINVKTNDFEKFYEAAFYTMLTFKDLPEVENAGDFYVSSFRFSDIKNYEEAYKLLHEEMQNSYTRNKTLISKLRGNVYAEMGTVLYEVSPDELYKNSREDYSFVSRAVSIVSCPLNSYDRNGFAILHCNIGEFDITPSREFPQYTDKTIAALKTKLANVALEVINDSEYNPLKFRRSFVEEAIRRADNEVVINEVKEKIKAVDDNINKLDFNDLFIVNVPMTKVTWKKWEKYTIRKVTKESIDSIVLNTSNGSFACIANNQAAKILNEVVNYVESKSCAFNWRHFYVMDNLKNKNVFYTRSSKNAKVLSDMGYTDVSNRWEEAVNLWSDKKAKAAGEPVEKLDNKDKKLYKIGSIGVEIPPAEAVSFNEIMALVKGNAAKLAIIPTKGNKYMADAKDIFNKDVKVADVSYSYLDKICPLSTIRCITHSFENHFNKLSFQPVIIAYGSVNDLRKNKWGKYFSSEDIKKDFYSILVEAGKTLEKKCEMRVPAIVRYFTVGNYSSLLEQLDDNNYFKSVCAEYIIQNNSSTSADNSAVDYIIRDILTTYRYASYKVDFDIEKLNALYRDNYKNVEEELYKKYPMLEFVRSIYDSEDAKKIIDYVK